MTEEQKKIIELINKGFTCNQIASTLNITNKQLYSRLLTLKNKGIDFDRKYYSDGNIVYTALSSLKKIIDQNNKINENIITGKNEQEMTIMVISDIHLGSSFQRIDLLNRVYDYCKKNNINIIFNCGDLIDGTFGKTEGKIIDVYSQMDYLIKQYPFDENILNFCVGGDHDISALFDSGQNLISVLKNYRHDINMSTFTNALIGIKNEQINLNHHTVTGKPVTFLTKQSINLIGHTHRAMSTEVTKKRQLNVVVPSLSNLTQTIPAAIEMKLIFHEGHIKEVFLKQLGFEQKEIKILSENLFVMPPKKSCAIDNEEDYNFNLKSDTESDVNIEETNQEIEKPKIRKLNQIEKFNKRYGF